MVKLTPILDQDWDEINLTKSDFLCLQVENIAIR